MKVFGGGGVIADQVRAKAFAKAVAIASSLELVSRLGEGSKTTGELASECGVAEGVLRRVLRMLLACGVFASKEGKIANNARSRELGAAGAWFGHPKNWDRFAELDLALRTGKGPETPSPASADAELRDLYDRALQEPPEIDLQLARECRLEDAKTIVDVGGGTGGLAGALAKQYSSAKVFCLDRHSFSPEAFPEGATFQEGSFFEPLPSADAYVLKRVLHAWSDSDALKILNRCREGLPAGGRAIAFEYLIDDSPESSFAAAMDLEMLSQTGGKIRDEAEFRSLFEQAGLDLREMRRGPGGLFRFESLKT